MRRVALAAAALTLAGCSADQDTKIYRVPSSSMEPTLHCARPALGCEGKQNDLVAVRPYGDEDPTRGDITAFRTPLAAQRECGAGGIFIKRIVALPGETWAERHGYVYIDGRKLDEPYLSAERRDTESHPALRIPRDRYFLLGDNRASSCDSRRWGAVPRSSLIGRTIEIKRGSKRIHIR
jgi:signal peptidase I